MNLDRALSFVYKVVMPRLVWLHGAHIVVPELAGKCIEK